MNFGLVYEFSKFYTLSHIKFTDFFYSVFLWPSIKYLNKK